MCAVGKWFKLYVYRTRSETGRDILAARWRWLNTSWITIQHSWLTLCFPSPCPLQRSLIVSHWRTGGEHFTILKKVLIPCDSGGKYGEFKYTNGPSLDFKFKIKFFSDPFLIFVRLQAQVIGSQWGGVTIM